MSEQLKNIGLQNSMKKISLGLIIFVLTVFKGHSYAQDTLVFFNFDNDVITDWTYDAWGLNGGANKQCSWAIGVPGGSQGYNDVRGQRGYVGNPDPAVDHTIANAINNVVGQGLSPTSKKEGGAGHYNNSSEWLQSPVINCANYYDVTLDYYRWANFEPGYDFGFIEISTDGQNWTVLYNPATLEDNGWVRHTIDISKYADRQATVYIRWRSESDNTIYYAGWNIDDVTVTGKLSNNDYTSSFSSGSIAAPSTVSSLLDTYEERITIGEFFVNDAGSGDGLPTIIDTLIITPGSSNSVVDWKKAITNIYINDSETGTEIEGSFQANKITFTDTTIFTIPDGGSKAFSISFYVEPDLSGIDDNSQFEFVIDYGTVIVNPAGSFISSGVISTGSSKLYLDINATQLSFLVEPEQLVTVNRDLLPIVQVAATDANGNVDMDYSGTITLSNSGGLSMTGTSETTVDGVALFAACQFTETGGPILLYANHNGSPSIVSATTIGSVIIDADLGNSAFFEDFDNGGLAGWASGATLGSNSWVVESPDGGVGYSELNGNRGQIGNPDPTVDHTANNATNFVYGQGLGPSSQIEGRSGYYNNSEEWLMSPAIDLTSYYNTQLSFWRWANMEPYYDTAYVEISVDGTNWIDLGHPHFPTDNQWTRVIFDISTIADRQATVYIRWRSVSDESVFYAGWNIDDVEIGGIYSPIITWSGLVSTDWLDPANWSSNIVPDRTANVFIDAGTPFYPIVSGTAECNELVIKKNAILEISPSGDLSVYGDVKIETDYYDYGALVDHGTCNIYGTGIVSRYLYGKRWNYVSSPIENISSTVFGEEVYYYDESLASDNWNNGWVWAQTAAMETARGYDVYKYLDNIVQLEGKFHTGSCGITVTNTDGLEVPEHEGWNLIGNPYPSAIDWDAPSGWTKTNINNAIYIWDESKQNFVTYISGVGANGGSSYIPPMQGFFVKVSSPGTGYVGMNNDVRISNVGSKFKAAINEVEGLKLRISNSQYSDEAVVRFVEGAGMNFDLSLDAHKKFTDSYLVPQIFTKTGKEEELAINTYPEDTDYAIIPVYIKVNKAGDYKVEFEGIWNIDYTQTVYLEDILTDSLIDVQDIKSYSFYSQRVISEHRFNLHVGMPLNIEYNVTNASGGSSDGAIDLKVIGGKQPILDISWSNGAKSEDLTNIAAGEYVVTVTDNANNVLVDTIIVGADGQNNVALGIDEQEISNAIKIFADKENVLIQSSEKNSLISDIAVYDLAGRKIKQQKGTFIGEAVIHTGELNGLYLVRVIHNQQISIQKVFIK